MLTLLILIHVLVCFLLIAVVLLQSGRGAEIGVSFGATYSQTLFGSRGPASFLSKVTVVLAAVFMLSALGISILSSRLESSSVIEEGTVFPSGPIPGEETAAPSPSESPSKTSSESKASSKQAPASGN